MIALLGIAVVAAACQANTPADPAPEIKPGICVADETRDQGDVVPDLSSIVDCRRLHAYEVYDIIDLPSTALTGSTRQERIDNRDDLAVPSELPDDSAQREAYEEFAEHECATSLQRVTGFDELELRGTSAEDARVVPALRGADAPWYSVMPEKQWLDGRRQVVCSIRFEDPESSEPGRPPIKRWTTSTDRPLVTQVGTASFPVELRQCRAYDDKRSTVDASPCAEPHVDEALFFFEADAVFGTTFIENIQKRPTPKKFDRFDDVCAEAFPQLLGRGYDDRALRGFGSVARRWTEKHKTVRCSVGPVEFRTDDLPPGSLVGTGAEDVGLIRAK